MNDKQSRVSESNSNEIYSSINVFPTETLTVREVRQSFRESRQVLVEVIKSGFVIMIRNHLRPIDT